MKVTTSAYTLKHAESIKATPSNTMPSFDLSEVRQLKLGSQDWDNGNLKDQITNRDATVGGFHVIWALERPEGAPFSVQNRLSYFFSKDGIHYTAGGYLFDKPLYEGTAEWSGSLILRTDGRLQMFYTIEDGIDCGDGVWQSRQRLATAILPVEYDEDTLHILPPDYHALIHGAAEPDGTLYETPMQAAIKEKALPTQHKASIGSDQTENNCGRDPFFFYDAKSGDSFLFFEGNTGSGAFRSGVIHEKYLGRPLGKGFAPTTDMLKANGCVGVIRFTNDEHTYGYRLDPLLVFNLVTDEFERINVIQHDGGYYLFGTCHGNKMTPNAANPDMVNRDFLMGFRMEHLGGPLVPLNGNGVVITQKSLGDAYSGQEQNQQCVYSWLPNVPQNGVQDDLLHCFTYSNYCTDAEGNIKASMNAGPSLWIRVKGLKTELADLSYDVKPS